MKKVYIICISAILVFALVVSFLVISVDRYNDMEKKTYIVSAQKYINYMIDDPDKYDLWIDFLQGELTNGKLSLCDVGITNEKLEELRISGCKLSAQKCLNSVRKDPSKYYPMLEFMLEDLEEGNLSLSDIDTDKEEIERLQEEGLRMDAKKCLERIRKDRSGYNLWVDSIEEALDKGVFPPEEALKIRKELLLLSPKPEFNPKKMAQAPCFLQQGVFCCSFV